MPDTNAYVVPDIDADMFFWNGWWWRPWEGRWYRSHYYNRGWAYYGSVPSFYFDIDPGWRGYYRDHNWYGHRWNYERIPNRRLQQNWKSWHTNRYWERQKAWGVQSYQPRHRQQRQELRHQRQEQYQQRPEVQRHQQQRQEIRDHRQEHYQERPEAQRHQQQRQDTRNQRQEHYQQRPEAQQQHRQDQQHQPQVAHPTPVQQPQSQHTTQQPQRQQQHQGESQHHRPKESLKEEMETTEGRWLWTRGNGLLTFES